MANVKSFKRSSDSNQGAPQIDGAPQYNAARATLLLAIILTAINIFMLTVFKDTTYFVFSFMIPFYLVNTAAYITGKLPAEYYEGSLSDYEFYPASTLYIAVAIAAVILAVYVIAYVFSSKHRTAFLILALVLFAIDTLGTVYLFYDDYKSVLLTFLFEAFFLYELIRAIRASMKLNRKPNEVRSTAVLDDEESEAYIGYEQFELLPSDGEDTIIRANVYTHALKYRKEKNRYFLNLDGEDVASVKIIWPEAAHALTATVESLTVSVGYNGLYNYVLLNGTAIYMTRRYKKAGKPIPEAETVL